MSRVSRIAPLLLGGGLFLANNAGAISGWIATPEGYAPLMHVDATDNAIYESWLRSSQDRLLHPNFQAPWQTTPAILSPLLYLIAKVARLTGLSLNTGWFLAHLGLYILAAYALFMALDAFTKTPRERTMALAMLLLVVPVQSYLVLPSALLPLGRLGIPPLPGLGAFVWRTSDGFLHGIGGSILVTYGTAATLAAFACLARYMETGERRFLLGSGAATLLCGLVHPYEPYLIVATGCVALLLWKWPDWKQSFAPAATLAVSGALGIVPLAILALTHPWMRDTANLTRWNAPNPLVLLAFLGLPAIAAVTLLPLRRRMPTASDLLLQCWVVGTLVGVYVPFLPWTKHFLDGFLYAVVILLARQLSLTPSLGRLWQRHRRLAMAGTGALFAFSAFAYLAYYRQAWEDGVRPQPQRLFRGVVPEGDVAARDWLTEHGRYTDLVLAPRSRATWFSGAPMHSIAGNYLFSITYEEQARLSDAFFAGQMDQASASELLSRYGVRWIVTPPRSPALPYLDRAKERARVGAWTIFEIEGAVTAPYPGLTP